MSVDELIIHFRRVNALEFFLVNKHGKIDVLSLYSPIGGNIERGDVPGIHYVLKHPPPFPLVTSVTKESNHQAFVYNTSPIR